MMPNAACIPAIPCCTRQLVLSLAPLMQPARVRGISTQVQEHLGALAEALASKVTRAACDAHAVGEACPAGRFAWAVAGQFDFVSFRRNTEKC